MDKTCQLHYLLELDHRLKLTRPTLLCASNPGIRTFFLSRVKAREQLPSVVTSRRSFWTWPASRESVFLTIFRSMKREISIQSHTWHETCLSRPELAQGLCLLLRQL